mmetsp:Transcript_65291/g.174036  ORF Transcript_65291/g.174036 Transcript_65291/m.174036 type:complete len:224 (-) Transcript_65291:278-949(-)
MEALLLEHLVPAQSQLLRQCKALLVRQAKLVRLLPPDGHELEPPLPLGIRLKLLGVGESVLPAPHHVDHVAQLHRPHGIIQGPGQCRAADFGALRLPIRAEAEGDGVAVLRALDVMSIGLLHEGHLRLLDLARLLGPVVGALLFVGLPYLRPVTGIRARRHVSRSLLDTWSELRLLLHLRLGFCLQGTRLLQVLVVLFGVLVALLPRNLIQCHRYLVLLGVST